LSDLLICRFPLPSVTLRTCSSHRIVGFEVKARSVDVNRYITNSDDPNDNSCKIKGVTDGAGGLVLSSETSRFGLVSVSFRLGIHTCHYPLLIRSAQRRVTLHCTTVDTTSAVTEDGTQDIVWSYSVQWEPSDIAWASRWDTYLKMEDVEIHWFSIINSLVTVIFLSGTWIDLLVLCLSQYAIRTAAGLLLLPNHDVLPAS